MTEDQAYTKALAIQYTRMLADQYTNAGKPTEWFEQLYSEAIAGKATVPWADLKVNPNLVTWLNQNQVQGEGKTALVVGCGLGDDAEELRQRGFQTTGFDISASAIRWCDNRFPDSTTQYVVADLFHPPTHWQQAFDFVLESYTLQSLPRSLYARAIVQIANFIAPEGRLLLICRGREPEDALNQVPYPFTKDEIMQLTHVGLSLETFEDYLDDEEPPVRRFRVVFRRMKDEG
jgi:SAM-dependent methyltransferase